MADTQQQDEGDQPMVPLNSRVPTWMKTDGVALAARRGMKLSGLVKFLLARELEADRAATLASTARGEPGPTAGRVRNVTRRLLTGECLHPIHMRHEVSATRERCGGCGQDLVRRPR